MRLKNWYRENIKYASAVFTAIYVTSMIFILIIRPGTPLKVLELTRDEYWKNVMASYNFIPFHTLKGYWSTMCNPEANLYLKDIAFTNVYGNFFLFIPIGFILPGYFKKQRNVLLFFVTTLLIIFAVETVQLFTLRGFFDMDDIILNVSAAMLGWIVIMIVRAFMHKDTRLRKGD